MSWRTATVVLGCIAICTTALAIPAIGKLRARAAVVRCRDNLRVLVMTSDFGPGTVVNPELPVERRLSWHANIADALSKSHQHHPLNWSAAWDVEPNRSIATAPIARLICPGPYADPPAGFAITNYVGLGGLGPDGPTLPVDSPKAGVFRYDTDTHAADIRDGLSRTAAVIETYDRPGPWLAGGFPTVRPLLEDQQPYLGVGRQFGGCHPGVVLVGFADGSVRDFGINLNPQVFVAHVTICGRPTQRDTP